MPQKKLRPPSTKYFPAESLSSCTKINDIRSRKSFRSWTGDSASPSIGLKWQLLSGSSGLNTLIFLLSFVKFNISPLMSIAKTLPANCNAVGMICPVVLPQPGKPNVAKFPAPSESRFTIFLPYFPNITPSVSFHDISGRRSASI